MMNILLIHPHDLYSSSEPWTIRIKQLAHQFAKKGHAVKLVYFALHSKDANKIFFNDDIQTISLDRRLGAYLLLKNTLYITKLAAWADIIHFQKCYYYAALPALIAAWIRNKPVHYDWDDWETKIFYYSNPGQIVVGGFLDIFEHFIPKLVDTISVSSRHLRRLCIRRGVAAKRIFAAPVGADLERFTPDLSLRNRVKPRYSIKNHLVLYLGQLHGGQYAELFIRAARIVLSNRQDVTFMVVGHGYRLGELKTLAEQEGIGKYLIFTGAVSHEEAPYYIADADVCVACFENNDITKCKSPLKIVEYLASGKAIVASNVGEVRNMVGGAGILTRAGSADSLADGILTLLKDKKLRDDLGKCARERAITRYNWHTTANNLLSAYSEAIKTHAAS